MKPSVAVFKVDNNGVVSITSPILTNATFNMLSNTRDSHICVGSGREFFVWSSEE